MTSNNDNEFGFTPNSGYTVIEESDYDAVVMGIVFLGRHPREPYQGKARQPVNKLKIMFEIPDIVRENTDPPETAMMAKKVNLSDSVDKGMFAATLQALGEHPTKDNIVGYMRKESLVKLLGRGVVLTVKHFEGEKGVVAYVDDLTKLHSKIPVPKATRETFYFNPLIPDLNVFNNNLSYYTQKEIMSALNAEQYPKELHAAWVKAQEAHAAKEAEKGNTGNISATNTESIE